MVPLILAGLLAMATVTTRAAEPALLEIQKILASKRFVDLTHAFEPGIPRQASLNFPQTAAAADLLNGT